MRLRHLWLVDFRNYEHLDLEPSEGLTVVAGANGEGKTNLVEAIGFLATLDSFRGAPAEALVRQGAERAVVRAEVVHADGRQLLVEADVPTAGRVRAQVNRQRLSRTRELLGVLRVTVFSPDDLALLKGGPGERRRLLDDLLVALGPRFDLVRTDLERVLRQRNALLRQAAGRLTREVELTLDVWDAKLAELGEAVGRARATLVSELEPLVGQAYLDLAGGQGVVGLRYDPAWRQHGLAEALAASRSEDLRRQHSSVGPHRDDLEVVLDGLPARTHASQGEQRTLALALRLGGHTLVTLRLGTPPVLLLDDVFSELDADRSRALVDHLPTGQTLLTTAGSLPAGTTPERVVRIVGGKVVP